VFVFQHFVVATEVETVQSLSQSRLR